MIRKIYFFQIIEHVMLGIKKKHTQKQTIKQNKQTNKQNKTKQTNKQKKKKNPWCIS